MSILKEYTGKIIGVSILSAVLCVQSVCAGNITRTESRQTTDGIRYESMVYAKGNKKRKRLSNYRMPNNDDDTTAAITYYVKHPKSVSQKQLGEIFYDYVAHTDDIGRVFCVLDDLSTDGLDKIVEDYITQGKNVGLYYNFRDHLSKGVRKRLIQYIDSYNKAIESGKKPKSKSPMSKYTKVVQQDIGSCDEDDEYEDDDYEDRNCNGYDRKNHCRTDGTYIDKYVLHPKKYTQKKLDSVFIKFIKKTDDIGQVFNVIEYLSPSAVDKIAEYYLKKTDEWGLYDSLKAYMSRAGRKKLGKLADKYISRYDW